MDQITVEYHLSLFLRPLLKTKSLSPLQVSALIVVNKLTIDATQSMTPRESAGRKNLLITLMNVAPLGMDIWKAYLFLQQCEDQIQKWVFLFIMSTKVRNSKRFLSRLKKKGFFSIDAWS